MGKAIAIYLIGLTLVTLGIVAIKATVGLGFIPSVILLAIGLYLIQGGMHSLDIAKKHWRERPRKPRPIGIKWKVLLVEYDPSVGEFKYTWEKVYQRRWKALLHYHWLNLVHARISTSFALIISQEPYKQTLTGDENGKVNRTGFTRRSQPR